MPKAPKRPCSFPGCGRLVEGGSRCDEHRRKAFSDREGTSSSRGYGSRWRRLRILVLHRSPVCPCGDPATEVDHIRPRSEGGDDSIENLRGLCTACHRAKSGREGAAATARAQGRPVRDPVRDPVRKT